MKYIITTILALASTLLLSQQTLAAPIEIKFSHVVSENTPKGRMAIKFQELVAERMAGKVVVKVYPNSQLFSDDNVLEAMLLGDVEMAAPSLSKFEKYTQKLQIFDLPFLFKDMEAVERFQNSAAGKQLLNSLESKLLVGLGYLHNGMKQLSASHPIRLPADMAGKKFRIQASDVLQAQFEAVGAVPLKKPFAEVFTLLQTKAIDGQENTWSNMYSKKFHEVQSYILESNHGVLDYLVVTSAEFWYGLPEEIRAELTAILNESIAHGNHVASMKSENDRDLIKDAGTSKIIEMSNAEREKWVEAMTPVWKLFEKDIGADLIRAAQQANNAQVKK